MVNLRAMASFPPMQGRYTGQMPLASEVRARWRETHKIYGPHPKCKYVIDGSLRPAARLRRRYRRGGKEALAIGEAVSPLIAGAAQFTFSANFNVASGLLDEIETRVRIDGEPIDLEFVGQPTRRQTLSSTPWGRG
jgi:hypothetical protein